MMNAECRINPAMLPMLFERASSEPQIVENQSLRQARQDAKSAKRINSIAKGGKLLAPARIPCHFQLPIFDLLFFLGDLGALAQMS